MTRRNKWLPTKPKLPKKVHNPVAATLADPTFRSKMQVKLPKKVHNPVAATLADPAFRPQKVKNPNIYNRKVKHKKDVNKG